MLDLAIPAPSPARSDASDHFAIDGWHGLQCEPTEAVQTIVTGDDHHLVLAREVFSGIGAAGACEGTGDGGGDGSWLE